MFMICSSANSPHLQCNSLSSLQLVIGQRNNSRQLAKLRKNFVYCNKTPTLRATLWRVSCVVPREVKLAAVNCFNPLLLTLKSRSSGTYTSLYCCVCCTQPCGIMNSKMSFINLNVHRAGSINATAYGKLRCCTNLITWQLRSACCVASLQRCITRTAIRLNLP